MPLRGRGSGLRGRGAPRGRGGGPRGGGAPRLPANDERLPGWGVNHDERLPGWGVNHDSYEAEDLGDPDEEGRANALALERDRLVNPDYGEFANRGRSGYRRRADEVLPVRDDNADSRRAARLQERKTADTQGGGKPGRPRDTTLDNVREEEAVAPAPKARPAVKTDAPPPAAAAKSAGLSKDGAPPPGLAPLSAAAAPLASGTAPVLAASDSVAEDNLKRLISSFEERVGGRLATIETNVAKVTDAVSTQAINQQTQQNYIQAMMEHLTGKKPLQIEAPAAAGGATQGAGRGGRDGGLVPSSLPLLPSASITDMGDTPLEEKAPELSTEDLYWTASNFEVEEVFDFTTEVLSPKGVKKGAALLLRYIQDVGPVLVPYPFIRGDTLEVYQTFQSFLVPGSAWLSRPDFIGLAIDSPLFKHGKRGWPVLVQLLLSGEALAVPDPASGGALFRATRECPDSVMKLVLGTLPSNEQDLPAARRRRTDAGNGGGLPSSQETVFNPSQSTQG